MSQIFALSRWAMGFIALCLSTVIYWNIAPLEQVDLSVKPIRGLALALRLNKYWNMFAPKPFSNETWVFASGQLENRETVNLLRPEKKFDFSPADSARDLFKNVRWRKYPLNFELKKYHWAVRQYAKYLCREHSSQFASPLQAVEIYLFSRKLNPASQSKASPQAELLIQHPCRKKALHAVKVDRHLRPYVQNL